MEKLPPFMGWSTWNQFHQHISEDIIMDVARAMKANGLLDAGYRYINLDDCWQASVRDEAGRLAFDTGRFPGKEGIVGKLNALGFKMGIYSSCGTLTCEDMPGSYGFEQLDANTFAAWGVEYLKYDYCHVMDINTDPHFSHQGFADKTPPILNIAVANLNGKPGETVFPAADAVLTPPAVREGDGIVGLDCPRASATFQVHAVEDGTYPLAVTYEKTKPHPHKRFLLVSVNGLPDVQVWFPPTSGWHSPARVTAFLQLKAGENKITLTNPIRSQREDSIMRYTQMGEALKKAAPPGKPIYYAICEHGRTAPWTWAADIASSWRISGDISARWEGVMKCYETIADLWKYQQPGTYNDPDMLEVGIGNLTETENRSHFILWCMLSAPLVLGLDVRTINEKTLKLITNPDYIAINQDEKLLQASRTRLTDTVDVLIKPLSGERFALCVFNKGDASTDKMELQYKDMATYDPRLDLQTEAILQIPAIAPRDVFLSVMENTFSSHI